MAMLTPTIHDLLAGGDGADHHLLLVVLYHHLVELVAVDLHPPLLRVPRPGLHGEVDPGVHVLGLLSSSCPGSVRPPKNSLAATG